MQLELVAPADAGGEAVWPYEADFILSTLQAAPAQRNVWRQERSSHRVAATFESATASGVHKQVIFTRDLSAQSLGFITRTALVPGARGSLWLPLADGTSRTVPCKVARCRSVAPGWLEGVLQFDRAPAQRPQAAAAR